MPAIDLNELTIYELDNERVIAPDTEEGRAAASEAIAGSRAEADAARPTGLAVTAITPGQIAHLERVGWCMVD